MRLTGWDRRFWASTRGRIVLMLRRGSRTVRELAQALGVTGNAVRGQLALLERDGLIHQSGTRAGKHKPYLTYALTPEAQQLFPRLYGPVLRHLLDVLAGNMPAKKLEAALRTVWHRVAEGYRPAAPADTPQDRLRRGVNVLGELGGLAAVEHQDGRAFLRCFDCPLALVVAGHPEVCKMVETVLTETLGVPVAEHCQRGGVPQCLFEVLDGGQQPDTHRG